MPYFLVAGLQSLTGVPLSPLDKALLMMKVMLSLTPEAGTSHEENTEPAALTRKIVSRTRSFCDCDSDDQYS